jgi:hypothetical protein
MSQTSQSRQPKGKREGGQYAESKNPEPTVDLAPIDGRRDAIVDRIIDNELRRSIAVDREKLENVDDLENDEEIELLQDVVDQQADLISRQDQRIAELARSQMSNPIVNCAYAVDEAIDVITRWEAGSGADPTDVLIGLMETRAELFNLAESKNPDVVAAWHGCESRIRDFEAGNESISDEEFDKLRDEREALFVDIVRMSLAKSNETRAEVVAGISWTKSDAEAMAGAPITDEQWLRVTDRFADLLANGASGDGLRDGLMLLMDAPEGDVG